MVAKLCLRRVIGLAVVLLAWAGYCRDAEAQVYVVYHEAGIINKYDVDNGALIKERFIEGLTEPRAICYDHDVLYILQQSGTIGKYDAATGAAINDHFISGFNMPQAMAVSDGAIYVASFSWQFQHLGEADNMVGKFDEATGSVINANFLKTDQLAAALAVADHKLIIGCGAFPNRPHLFDTSTGTPIQELWGTFLGSSTGVATQDDMLWFTAGPSAYGAIFKYNAHTGESAGGVGPFHPLARNINLPGRIAVSGDDLFVNCGRGTAITKYNANTGDLIKDAFIPDRGDRCAGIAVVPRAPSGQYTLAQGEFDAKNTYLKALIWAILNPSYLYLGAGMLVVLAVVGFGLFYQSRSPVAEAAVAAVESPLESLSALPVEPAPSPEESAASTPPPASVSPSFLGMAAVGLFAITLVIAGALAWFASQAASMDLTHSRPDHTPDLIGLWGIDPNDAEAEGKAPAYHQVYVYPDHLEYSAGHGTTRVEGRWHDDGFWTAKPDGSGDVEVCHLKDPLELEIRLATFASGEQDVDLLYKMRGSDAEMQELTDKYPKHITYPPPAGVIKFWMSEYELNNLPWRADAIDVYNDDPVLSRKVYDYHSDDPNVPRLKVTVKNHRVAKIEGGNG